MSHSRSWLYNSVRAVLSRPHRPCQKTARATFNNALLHSNFGTTQTMQQATQLKPLLSSQNAPSKDSIEVSKEFSKGSEHCFHPIKALDEVGLIGTSAELAHILAQLPHNSSLYIDLEGHQLSRHGTLDVLSILVWPQGKVYLIDVYSLGKDTFTTMASNTTNHLSDELRGRTTLKEVLENPEIPKYLWDVRSDADALWSLYGVNIRGVTDLQLLENAARGEHRTRLKSLGQSISQDLELSPVERKQWHNVKDHGRQMMEPRPDFAGKPFVNAVMLGDNLLTTKIPKIMRTAALRAHQLRDLETADDSRGYRITEIPKKVTLDNSHFRQRPMDAGMMAYCANDVVHLPALHRHYMEKLGCDSPWHERVQLESKARVNEARNQDFLAENPDRRLSPWSDVETRQDKWLDVFEIDADSVEELEGKGPR